MREKPWSLPEERIVELFADWERKRTQSGSGLIELLRATEQEGQKALFRHLQEKGYTSRRNRRDREPSRFCLDYEDYQELCAALGVEP